MSEVVWIEPNLFRLPFGNMDRRAFGVIGQIRSSCQNQFVARWDDRKRVSYGFLGFRILVFLEWMEGTTISESVIPKLVIFEETIK